MTSTYSPRTTPKASPAPAAASLPWIDAAWLPWAVLGVGLVLRLVRYLADNSLEVAESELALNVMHRGFAGLLRPLDYDQGAPLGFLFLVKLASNVFGSGERSLRLVAFLSGVGALFAFRATARRFLGPRGALAALALFALAPTVLWYSAQVKQYSSDVLVSCALLLVAREASRRGLTARWLLLLVATGLLAIPLSHPAVFTLAGVGLALGVERARREDGAGVARIGVVGLVWSVAFGAFYVVQMHSLAANAYLQRYWSANLMPFPPRSFIDLRWYPSTFFGMFLDPVDLEWAAAAAAFAYLVGVLSKSKDDVEGCLLLTSPMLFALAASALKQYPFGRRLILFLVPSILILVAEGLDRLARATREKAAFVGPLLAALLLFEPALSGAHILVSPPRYEDLKPAALYLRDHRRPEDTLYVYFDAQYAFRYYAERLSLSTDRVIVGTSSESRWEEDLRDLDALRGGGRVWLLFSHIHLGEEPGSEERFFQVHLERMGTRLDSFRATGVALHLYELD